VKQNIGNCIQLQRAPYVYTSLFGLLRINVHEGPSVSPIPNALWNTYIYE
jgi:hypothetical protein